MAEDERLLDLARAVAEGASPDWDEAERSSGADGRDAVAQLRVVARLAEVYRRRDFGHYTDLLPIGAGGFGEVYRARDTRLQREVALKFLPPSASLAEGRLLAQVHHPNVVSVHGVESFEERSAIVMELVRGRTLHQILREEGPRPESEATSLGEGVARALVAVHGAGLVHGDVSARNVMRDEGGRVVLMDFGLGHRAGLEAGGLRGTRPYMAPEMLEGGRPTVASDVYALGVLLFQLRTGGFPSETPLAEAGRLRRVIERSLAPRPADRFQSAAEMLKVIGLARGSSRARRALAGAAVLAALTLVALVPLRQAPVATAPDTAPLAPLRPQPVERGSGSPLASPSPSAVRSPQGDPFVPPLGPGPGNVGDEKSPEAGLLTIEARLVGASTAAELELRTSRPVSLYVVREDEDTTALLFPLPGRRLHNPLDAGLRHRLPVPDPRGVILLGGPQRLAAFEERVALLRVPRVGAPAEVPLPAEALALLREGLGLPVRGRLLGRAPLLTGHLEIVRGVWVRRLVLD